MDQHNASSDMDVEVSELGDEVASTLNLSASGNRAPGNQADMDTLDTNDYEEIDFGERDEAPIEESDDEDMEESAVTMSEQTGAGRDVFTSVDGSKGADIEEKSPEEESLAMFIGHTDSIYAVSLSSNGLRAVTGAGDDKAMVWETSSGKRLFELSGHTDTIVSVGFNHTDEIIATASYDSTIRLYDSKTGNFLRALEGPGSEIEWMQWHSKGNVIVCGSEDGTAWIWNANDGKCMAVLAGHEASVTCGMFTRNGKLVTGSMDGTVKFWDPRTSECLHTYTGHDWHEAGVVSLALHPTEPIIAAGGQDGTVRFGRLDKRKALFGLNHNNENPKVLVPGSNVGSRMMREDEDEICCSVESISFADNGSLFASAGTDNTVKIWDLNTQTCRHVLKHNDSVVKVMFIPGTCSVITCSSDKTARLWDARSGNQVKVISIHSDMILDFAYDAAAHVLVTSSDDKTCRVTIV
mmetsp:Transcript_13152/g.15342  ORF Transcript_13152/g.15342 Transcript_13152/m.15342 type:complete len:466 (+) Transcript_13152:106-1503(+)